MSADAYTLDGTPIHIKTARHNTKSTLQLELYKELIHADILDEMKRGLFAAIREDIKVNSVVINENLVKVMEKEGGFPTMICGLKAYRDGGALPENYAFALFYEGKAETEFADRMGYIRENYGEDEEVCHEKMDELMCMTLRRLGFGEGVDIFEETKKWYA